MATPPAAGADRAWRGLALSVTALAHAVSLGAALLDGDRLLLARNPALHSFGGLLTLLSDGRVVARGVGLPLRDHCPLGALATWLSWQWFRGGAAAQHALSVALLAGVAAGLFDLLRAARAPAPLAAAAVLAFALSPATADLSASIAHRDALLALALALLAARRAPAAAAGPAVGWSAGAALAALLAGAALAYAARVDDPDDLALLRAGAGALAASALAAGAAGLAPVVDGSARRRASRSRSAGRAGSASPSPCSSPPSRRSSGATTSCSSCWRPSWPRPGVARALAARRLCRGAGADGDARGRLVLRRPLPRHLAGLRVRAGRAEARLRAAPRRPRPRDAGRPAGSMIAPPRPKETPTQ